MKRALLYIFFLLLFFTGRYASVFAQVVGKLYGTTYRGGSINKGTVNAFDPLNNNDTAVMNCTGATGNTLYGNLIQTKNGLLYGMAPDGGTDHNSANGDIFSYNLATGKDTVVYSFTENFNATDGSTPYGSLVLDTNGLMYGLTYLGGNKDSGTIFSFDPKTDSEKVLYSMSDSTIGYYPTGSLIVGKNGLLYGNTSRSYGGYGTIFSYNITKDTVVILYNFINSLNGDYPRGTVLQVNDSMLYGLTTEGGNYSIGVMYSFNLRTDSETVLVTFNYANGAYPEESLMQASDGNLYGTTYYGGATYQGALFRYNTDSNTITILVNFDSATGYAPFDDLIQASNGLLYGNTNFGGAYDSGTIFSYNIDSNIERTLCSYNITNGALPYGDLLEVMSAGATITGNQCPNDSTGALTINARGGKPPFTYLWSTGATTSSISNLKSGAYTYTVTDSSGMTLIYSDTLKPLPIAVNFTISNTCNGVNDGSAVAMVSGGTVPYTYSWSNGYTSDTISNIAAGTYTFIVTDAHGCPSAMNAIVITQAAVIAINGFTITESTFPNYNNGSITVQVSGGIPPGDSVYYLYLWSIGGSGNDSITALDSGKYSVCVTSPYGCGSVCDTGIDITGFENLTNPGSLVKVYPVPSSGLITVSLKGDDFENLEITNALGMPVYRQLLNSRLNNNTLHIDLSSLADGVYILQVNSRQSILTEKIIIQK